MASDDTIFAEAFYNHVSSDSNLSKEIPLKNVKRVLTDLSIKLGFDLEPVKDTIFNKHSHLNGVSFPIFKECLFQFFDKQEKILSTSFFVEENFESYQIDNLNHSNYELVNNSDNESNVNHNKRENLKFGFEYDVNMIILHRSLYILKRKFEMHELEILEIYSKFCEKRKPEYIIDIRNFNKVVEEILYKANFSFSAINKPGDLYKAELMNQMDKEKVLTIIQSLESFMIANRRKYNTIMREKKEKKYLNTNGENVEEEEENVINPEYNNSENINYKIEENKNLDINNSNEMFNDPQSSIQENSNEIEKKSNVVEHKTDEFTHDNNNYSLQLRKELRTFFIEKSSEDESNSLEFSNVNNSNIVHKSKNLTRIEYLLIEVLPLMIADFVHDNSNLVIVEIEDELRQELRTLFDNKILIRLGDMINYDIDQDKANKLKELLYEKLNTEKNTRFYEDLLIKKQATGENVTYIAQMLKKLQDQKIWIEKKIQSIQDNNNTYNNFGSLVKSPNLAQTELKIITKEFNDDSLRIHHSNFKKSKKFFE